MLNAEDILKRFEESESLSINDLAKIVPLNEARWGIDKLIEMGFIEDAIIKWHMGYAQTDHDAIQYRISPEGRAYLSALQEKDLKQKRDRIWQWVIFIIPVIIAIATLIVTALK